MTYHCSEVAALQAQIRAEYEAGVAALHSLAAGTARHDFIQARQERMGTLHEKLQDLVGKDAAMPLVIEVLEGVPS